jgi:hypothetical protein
MPRKIQWRFPLPRTHTGILQGNARLGVMIWGEGGVLRVTLGRSDFWDHRGGMPWTEKQNYGDIRRHLEQKDAWGLRSLFRTATEGATGQPARPSLIPVGRIEVDFGERAELKTGELHLADGTVAVHLRKGGKKHLITIALDMAAPVVCVAIPRALGEATVRRVPAWEHVGDHLKSISFEPPEPFDDRRVLGWVQKRPNDPPLCVASLRHATHLWMCAVYGEDVDAARAAARDRLRDAAHEGMKRMVARAREWWDAYWNDVPHVSIPNETIQLLYDYGMYKFAGLTQPGGVAAGLQGAWIEEHQMPPWSGDYHFNINVQMCYWPAYRGNRLSHLTPLFEMLWSWRETLRHNAKVFLDIDDGLMLPHAVDDRCTCMGGFWTGTIDHGCTAWVADMMWQYYRYSLDEAFLRERAFPFMVGVMRVYEQMLERDGEAFVLPVSVSPEYRGASLDAWGQNASFQLACIHRLCEDVLEAARVLGSEPSPAWSEILAKLPKATVVNDGRHDRIALWKGTTLEESHRHHSHLAAIAPFDVIDVDDPDWRTIIQRTHDEWVRHGMGLWSGWCVPWASMLHTRLGNPEMAELLLEIWERVFTNEGRGTLHDSNLPGFSLLGAPPLGTLGKPNERMQMDGGMGCVAAIQEMLLHTRRGVNHVLRGAPRRWRDVSFSGMRTDGAFLVGAVREDGEMRSITVKSERGGVFRLANPWKGRAACRRRKKTEMIARPVIEISMEPGEDMTITPST